MTQMHEISHIEQLKDFINQSNDIFFQCQSYWGVEKVDKKYLIHITKILIGVSNTLDENLKEPNLT